MRMDRMTSRLQMALSDAQSLALGKDHNFIEPVHLMKALLDQNGSVSSLLKQVNVDVPAFAQRVEMLIEQLPSVEGGDGDVHMSNSLGRLLNIADKYTQKKGDQFVSSEMVLLASLEEKGALGALLKKLSVTQEGLEHAIESVRGGDAVNDQNAEESREALDKFTVDLTAKAS